MAGTIVTDRIESDSSYTSSLNVAANVVFSGANISFNAGSSIALPVGTTAQRPTTLFTGLTRYNTSLAVMEFYDGTQWVSMYDGIVSTPAYAASGGSITTSGSWRIHTFTSSSTITFSQAGRIQLLVVAGGGGGGEDVPGGGGAGGVVYSAAYPVTASTYTVTVGLGGAGSTGSSTRGSVGANSAFGSIVAFGGGGGGSWNYTNPSEGGSGGGADGQNNYYTRSGARATQLRDLYPYTIGYGNRGGNGGGSRDSYSSGGGGGGAGMPGGDGDQITVGVSPWQGDSRCAMGGDGLAFDISGTSTYYAGGGGGATNNGTGSGIGGLGGGGSASYTSPTAGTTNTGGGGGGHANGRGAAGGSGIVILRYLV